MDGVGFGTAVVEGDMRLRLCAVDVEVGERWRWLGSDSVAFGWIRDGD